MLNRARSGGRGGPRQPFYPYPPERVLGHSRPLYAYLPFCLIRGKHSYKLVLSILGKGWYPYHPLPFSWATRFPLLVGAGGGYEYKLVLSPFLTRTSPDEKYAYSYKSMRTFPYKYLCTHVHYTFFSFYYLFLHMGH